jgi:hypothetical protein
MYHSRTKFCKDQNLNDCEPYSIFRYISVNIDHIRNSFRIIGARDRLCGLAVRVLGYRSGGPGSILGTTRKKVVGLEPGPLSLVSTTEELLDRKVAAPV